VKTVQDLFSSKKFLVSLLTLILGIGSKFVPELKDLDPVELVTLLSPLIAYIIGQGIADSGKEAAKLAPKVQILEAEELRVEQVRPEQ
jgi:hypothetical protein